MSTTKLLAGARSLPEPKLRPIISSSSLACCFALTLAWGCSDDVSAPEATSDGGGLVEAGTSSGKSDAGATSTDLTSSSETQSVVSSSDTSSTKEDPTEATEATSTSSEARASSTSDIAVVTSSAPDTEADDTTSAPVEPSVCDNLPAAPVPFFVQYGFERSEDFAFDEFGNYVGVDGNSNLVRIDGVGRRQLWVPNIAGTTAGMAALPDGSVVICDVSEGSIKRAYPNGYVSTVLGGLEYPNGLDVGPDGFIYVAENNAGRVRRIDPDTGEFSIVAMGLYGPNGVAFGNDPSIMYVGSFEGSGVYRVDIPTPGALGTASVLARPNGSELPDPELACPDQEVGETCQMGPHGALGKCQAVANVVDCFRYDRCPELPEGAHCDYPEYGTCSSGVCTVPCANANPWDVCTPPYGGEEGVCAPQQDGSLECRAPSPCDQLEEGAACAIGEVEGTCSVVEDYYFGPGSYYALGDLYCRVPGPCADKQEGSACVTDGHDGICQASGDDELNCEVPPPCEGKSEGDSCETQFGAAGQCKEYWDGYFECSVIQPCDGQESGAACVDPYTQTPGTCVVGQDEDYTWSYCDPTNPCTDHAEGDPCEDNDGPGVCMSTGWELTCETPPCQDKEVGELCVVNWYQFGTCVAGDAGATLTCDVPSGCENKAVGDECALSPYEAGTCIEGEDGLTCQQAGPCDHAEAGDTCYTYDGTGECVAAGDKLECLLPCAGLSVGDACETSDGPGVCARNWGTWTCEPPDPCSNLTEGDSCSADFGTGACTALGSNYYYGPGPGYGAPVFPTPPGSPTPVPVAFALAASYDAGAYSGPSATYDAGASSEPGAAYDAGAYSGPGATYDAGLPPPPWPVYDGGDPYPEPETELRCLPVGDCSSLPEGAACSTPSQNVGSCFLGTCYEQGNPGGIDGMGVDMCGNVYAAEYVVGNVWRIAPDGKTELLAKLPSSWIPNIKWGRGLGGFDKDVMYVADRNEGRLFGVKVGVPGATEYYDMSNP